MKRVRIGSFVRSRRHALCIGAAAAILAGCGGSQTPVGVPGAPTQPAAVALHVDRGGSYRSVYSFKGNPDGASPLEGLIAVNATLYGTTIYGGAKGFGTVFDVSTAGAEHVLYSFEETPDGWYPLSALLALAGKLYGTTSGGGAGNLGTVFNINTSGGESVLYSFGAPPDGDSPWAGLLAVNGTLYGTTLDGGSGFGTVFALSTSGTENVLYKFKNEPDGAEPQAPLIQLNGTLYGTTYYGGGGSGDGYGTVFEVSTSGSERVLYAFKGSPDGAHPGLGGLLVVRGALYGTTESGGANNAGTVFKITTAGTESIVYSFKGAPDGAQPDAGLTDVGGELYGTTTEGGSGCASSGGCGTIFRVSRSGKERELYRFKGKPDGAFPETQLTDVGGRLYGTTDSGGTNNDGTVFRISP
jgi:uncharacterized repeat protein (TIGR03803 family)